MPQLEYFLVAESISVDQSTNRISLFNVVEEIQVLQLPAQAHELRPYGISQFVAVSSWNMAPEDHGRQFRVSLRASIPGTGQASEFPPIQFTAERRRQRVIQVLVGCPLIGTGDWHFELLLDGERRASHIITAVPAEPQNVLEEQSSNQSQH